MHADQLEPLTIDFGRKHESGYLERTVMNQVAAITASRGSDCIDACQKVGCGQTRCANAAPSYLAENLQCVKIANVRICISVHKL